MSGHNEMPVVSNKDRHAVALSYHPDDHASPMVIATGSGYTADKMIEVAQRMNIPIYVDSDTARFLIQLKLGQEIPEELYEVIAGIYGIIMQIVDKKKG